MKQSSKITKQDFQKAKKDIRLELEGMIIDANKKVEASVHIYKDHPDKYRFINKYKAYRKITRILRAYSRYINYKG